MIKWVLKRAAKAFGQPYNYDVGYMFDVIDTSTAAGLRLSAYPLISQYRGPKAAQSIWLGAIFASTLEGDCGPCVQLVVDMAVQKGADPVQLQRCFDGEPHLAGDVGLGFQFAMAAIKGDLEMDQLRAQIQDMYGQLAVVAASFAAASGRFYPVLKRGLGYGHSCARLEFRGAPNVELASG